MVHDFEESYRGIHEGVEVLETGVKGATKQYKLHWEGRPAKEDGWVCEKLISKQLQDAQSERAKDV